MMYQLCWGLYEEAKDLMIGIRDVRISKAGRISNKVAHDLSQMGEHEVCGVLFWAVPSGVSVLAERVCMNLVI